MSQDILRNLALFQLTDYCRDNGIDCAGSHVIKSGRGYTYHLAYAETSLPIASVTYTKNTPPIFQRYV
jgi:hypothetical protein